MGDKRDKAEWGAEEEELRGVVLADSFNERFMPATDSLPRALLPLCNIPLIEYTLEFLAAGGVKEIIVCTKSHADKIEEYLNKSKWQRGNVQVTVLEFANAIAPGDVLRELFSRQLLRAEFVLVTGDVVSNMRFDEVVQAHKARAKKDKRNVATLVLKQQHPRHLTRSREEGLVVAIDPATSQVLDYRRTQSIPGPVPIHTSIFETTNCVDIRMDLVDADIYIFSPVVLELFQDNFDYEDLPTFIKGVLQDEIRADRLFSHILTNEYAARVTNLRMYDSVSRDIMLRWAMPVAPDTNLLDDQYVHHRGNVYIDRDVSLARPVHIGRGVMLGAGTTVGAGTAISHSVIGKGCTIGANCTITDTYLWDNVVLGDNCKVHRAILCDNVTLADNVTVKEGAMVAYNVSLPAGAVVKMRSKLMSAAAHSEDEGFSDGEREGEETEWDGVRLLVRDDDVSDASDIEDFAEGRRPVLVRALSDDSEGEETDDSDDEDMEEPVDVTEQFFREVLDSVRGALEGGQADGVMVEINASKHAYNVPVQQVLEYLLRAALEDGLSLSGKDLKLRTKKAFSKLKPLLSNYLKTAEQQMWALETLEHYCIEHEPYANMLQPLLMGIYNDDLVDEDVITEWYNTTEDLSKEQQAQRQKVASFIEWLENADEEDSDDD